MSGKSRLGRVAQASTEYLLLLAIAVMLAVTLKKALEPAFQNLVNTLDERIESMFSQGNLHRFSVGK